MIPGVQSAEQSVGITGAKYFLTPNIIMIQASKGQFFMPVWKNMTLGREEHRKAAIFRRKMSEFKVFRIAGAWSAEQSVYHKRQNTFWRFQH